MARPLPSTDPLGAPGIALDAGALMGLRHLAFTVADIEAEVARLARHGIACEPVRVDEHTGQRFTFFADPDGLPLELYETCRA